MTNDHSHSKTLCLLYIVQVWALSGTRSRHRAPGTKLRTFRPQLRHTVLSCSLRQNVYIHFSETLSFYISFHAQQIRWKCFFFILTAVNHFHPHISRDYGVWLWEMHLLRVLNVFLSNQGGEAIGYSAIVKECYTSRSGDNLRSLISKLNGFFNYFCDLSHLSVFPTDSSKTNHKFGSIT